MDTNGLLAGLAIGCFALGESFQPTHLMSGVWHAPTQLVERNLVWLVGDDAMPLVPPPAITFWNTTPDLKTLAATKY